MRIRLGVAAFTGVMAFGPSLAYLLLEPARSGPLQWVMCLLPLALWLAAWQPRARRWLLPGSLALFMSFIVMLPVPAGFTWPRLAGIGLSLAITAAALSTYLPTLVCSMYAMGLVVCDYARIQPHAGHLSSTTLDVICTVLPILVLPMAFTLISQYWDQLLVDWDEDREASRLREARALAAERADASQSAVDRRIHETVLNTLAAIWRARISPDAARRQCKADLKTLDSLDDPAPLEVRALVQQALEHHPVPGQVLGVTSATLRFLEESHAQVAYSALSEVLRNVERHAQASTTSVRAYAIKERAVFIVEDDGVGMAEKSRQQFGMRRALTESVESVGGTVVVTSAPATGTTVTMTIPLAGVHRRSSRTATPVLDILLAPALVRAAMVSPVFLGLVLLVPTVAAFAWPAVLALCSLALFAVILATAFWWGSSRAVVLSWTALGLLLLVQATSWRSLQGCLSSGALHQVLFVSTSAMLLPVLAQRRLALRFTMLALALTPTLMIPFALPAACRSEALVPAVETPVWVLALVAIIGGLSRAFDRSRAELEQRWREIDMAEARRLAMLAADQRWRSVDAETRSVLSGIAEGRLRPEDPAIRSRARRLEMRLRSLLETSKIPSTELRTFMDVVIEEVTAMGAPIAVQVISAEVHAAPPVSVAERLLSVGAHSAPSGLTLTLVDDEILLSADRQALDAAGFVDMDETDDPAIAVATVSWSAHLV